jgi:hypothetical protein
MKQTMRQLLLLSCCITLAFAEIQTKGYIALDSSLYSKKENKHSSNMTLQQQLEVNYINKNFSSDLQLYAQQDTTDFNNKKDNERSFLRLDILNATYDWNEQSLTAGKSIKFWGALEAENIVDTFNIQDKRNDPFVTDKTGAWNIQYSNFTEDGEFSVIAKVYEQKNELSSSSYIYYPFENNESLGDSLKSEDSLYRPTVYLNYSGSVYGEYSLDYAFVYQNGYDSQRYLTKESNTYEENAYLVNKLMTYNTAVINSTLYKLEALYTDVIEDKSVSDYIHIALGVEHTLDQLENGAEVGIIGEYYYYETLQKERLSDIQLSQAFQNDIFLGMRYNLNDEADTNAVGGVIIDTQYNEQSYYIEFETRVKDMFKVTADYRYFNPSSTHDTVYARLGYHQRVAVNISYHF